MQDSKLGELGRIMALSARRAGVVVATLIIAAVMLHFFIRVLRDDAATEDTIKELQSRAITVSTNMMTGQVVDSEHGQLTRRGYTAMISALDGGFFEIMLLNVPESVCRRLYKRHWSVATSLYINDVLTGTRDEDADLCGRFNRMAFEFSHDLNEHIPNADKPRKRHCLRDSDCGSCSACHNGICHSGCKAGESCGMTLAGRAVCCAEQNFSSPMCCSYTEGESCCWGRNKCCPLDKPIRLTDGTCTDCFDSRVFALGEPPDLGQCLTLCPNRVDFGQGGKCMLPICADGQFTDESGACVACDQVGHFKTSAKECAKCANRSYENGQCSLPCPAGTLADATGHCHACAETGLIVPATLAACTEACPNRWLIGEACALNKCPVGTVADKSGACVSCDSLENIDVEKNDDCALCPNRELVRGACVLPCPEGTFRAENGMCVSCNEPMAIPVEPESGACQACPDRMMLNNYCFAACSVGQFRDGYGACRSCSDLNSYLVTQTASCAVCPNRSILLYQEGQGQQNETYCRSQYCPMDYFADRFGSCHDCYTVSPIAQTSKTECDKCSNRFWSPIEQTCRLKTKCEPGMLLDSFGVCQACNSATEAFSVIGHTEACDVCPNRYVFGYWCRRCPADVRQLNTKGGCQACGGAWDNRIATCSPVIRKEN